MTQKKQFRIAVVGTDSLRGKEIKSVLEQKKFPLASIEFYDPDVGEEYSKLTEFRGEPKIIHHLDEKYLDGLDLVYFASEKKISKKLGRPARDGRFRAIDLSEAFNNDSSVPLIVAGVNDEIIQNSKTNLIANPHPASIFLSHLIKLILIESRIKRFVSFILQPASAFDRSGMEELANQSVATLNSSSITKKVFKSQVAFNLISLTEEMDTSGFTEVEKRVVAEIKRILKQPGLPLFLSLIQAPVFHTYSLMSFFEIDRNMEIGELEKIFHSSPYFKLIHSRPSKPISAISVSGKDEIFIGQIKKEKGKPTRFWVWMVADNLTRGSALNAYEIGLRLAVKNTSS